MGLISIIPARKSRKFAWIASWMGASCAVPTRLRQSFQPRRTREAAERMMPGRPSATIGIAGRAANGSVVPFLPWRGAEPLRTVSCMYTSNLCSRSVIDRHLAHETC